MSMLKEPVVKTYPEEDRKLREALDQLQAHPAPSVKLFEAYLMGGKKALSDKYDELYPEKKSA